MSVGSPRKKGRISSFDQDLEEIEKDKSHKKNVNERKNQNI